MITILHFYLWINLTFDIRLVRNVFPRFPIQRLLEFFFDNFKYQHVVFSVKVGITHDAVSPFLINTSSSKEKILPVTTLI